MGGVGQEPARVLNFWQAVEMFNPQPLPSVNPVKNVYEVNDGLLPWDAGHPLRRIKIKDNLTWRHCVYVGVFDIQRVRELLQEKFGSDPESFDDRPSGQTALLAFMVTDEGEPLLGSEEFASCAWAAGRLRNPGPENPGWLTGFEAACEGCRRELGEITATEYLATTEDELGTPELSPREYEVGSRLDFQDLLRFADEVARQFAVEEVLSPAGFRVASLKVSKRKERAADGGEMLTSLFAADLAAVAEAVGQGEIGAALHAYLQGPGQAADRIDVLKQPRVVDEGVAPSFTPAGRWPARASQSLAYSQQFAANTIMRDLARGSGLYAVNGPPGTGKTTMLRELIAAIVVERAMRLADLAKPSDAFDRCFHWKTGGYSRTVSALKESLTGFEIVVASSNNGAVENISLEVPGLKAIDSDDWSEPVDYYRELATHMLSSAESMRRDDGQRHFVAAWGLVAGLLGRKANRQNFVSTFWFTPDGANPVKGFQDILKDFGKQPVDWPAAVRRFSAALREEEALRAERVAARANLGEVPRVEASIDQMQAELGVACDLLERLGSELARAGATTARAEHEEKIAVQSRISHRRFRPGVLRGLFGLSATARQWRERDRELAAILAEAEKKSRDAREQEVVLDAARQKAADAAEDCRARLNALGVEREVLREHVDEARGRWGTSVPCGGQPANSDVRELAGAWTDPEWNAARSRLFLAALQLHKAFAAAEPVRMTKGLRAAMDVVNGVVGPDVPIEAVKAAWQCLFLVVPVFSTTFASFARVFPHLGRESLGWLFIDEAGQATPQAAAGAIWRSRRVVAVGDPMQLEPVVTLPFTAQQALRDHFEVAEWWLPSRASAQRLADAANRYGTSLPAANDDETVWVGAPLRAHRRCLNPMFTISNAIAYNGLMVYGTANPTSPLRAPESSWIDVPNAPSVGNWVPEEGRQARRILSALVRRYGVEPSQIFVLSPFRDGADRIEEFCDEIKGLRGGTVHTAQGKEADVVILILGSNPNKPGSRGWASKRPNLVNVAVSRARQRLYVIGDFRTLKPPGPSSAAIRRTEGRHQFMTPLRVTQNLRRGGWRTIRLRESGRIHGVRPPRLRATMPGGAGTALAWR